MRVFTLRSSGMAIKETGKCDTFVRNLFHVESVTRMKSNGVKISAAWKLYPRNAESPLRWKRKEMRERRRIEDDLPPSRMTHRCR